MLRAARLCLPGVQHVCRALAACSTFLAPLSALPRHRPTAAEVARRLEEIISKLGQSGEPCAAGNDG